jgi:hypothetical protein
MSIAKCCDKPFEPPDGVREILVWKFLIRIFTGFLACFAFGDVLRLKFSSSLFLIVLSSSTAGRESVGGFARKGMSGRFPARFCRHQGSGHRGSGEEAIDISGEDAVVICASAKGA